MTDFRRSLSDATLVVAHPDDEILWFSSIFDQVGSIIVCYLDVPGRDDWTQGRRTMARDYPRSEVHFLGLTESVSFRGADWVDPVETSQGLALSRNPGTLPGFDPDRYHSNFDRLVAGLGERLNGCRTVITHNPWGEYGNEEHVQVYRAVSRLAESAGFDIWYSNYCSDRSFPLLRRHVGGRRSQCEVLPTQPERVAPIEALYRSNHCWTWPFDDYVYFPTEGFLQAGKTASVEPRGSTVPLNYIHLIDRAPAQHHASGSFGIRKIARSAVRRARRALQ